MSGGAEHSKAIGKARAGSTQLFGNPAEWQPGVRHRAPERPPPAAVLCPVDGLGIGELGKNPCRRFGDYMVAFAHDRYFARFPFGLPPFTLGHGGTKRQPWQGYLILGLHRAADACLRG